MNVDQRALRIGIAEALERWHGVELRDEALCDIGEIVARLTANRNGSGTRGGAGGDNTMTLQDYVDALGEDEVVKILEAKLTVRAKQADRMQRKRERLRALQEGALAGRVDPRALAEALGVLR